MKNLRLKIDHEICTIFNIDLVPYDLRWNELILLESTEIKK